MFSETAHRHIHARGLGLGRRGDFCRCGHDLRGARIADAVDLRRPQVSGGGEGWKPCRYIAAEPRVACKREKILFDTKAMFRQNSS